MEELGRNLCHSGKTCSALRNSPYKVEQDLIEYVEQILSKEIVSQVRTVLEHIFSYEQSFANFTDDLLHCRSTRRYSFRLGDLILRHSAPRHIVILSPRLFCDDKP